MADRELPNLGLKGFWNLGEDGWNTDHDLNLLKLSVLVQAGAISKVSATPGSPAEGDVHLFDETHATHPNTIAIYDSAAWVYVSPNVGWLVFNEDAGYYETFDGSAWGELATGGAAAIADLTDVDLAGLSDGQVLVWNATTSMWEPGDVSTGGGGGGATVVIPNYAAPLAADFPTIVVAAGATLALSDSKAGMGFKMTCSGSSGVHLALALRAASGAFNMVGRIRYVGKVINPFQAGFCVRNSANGKVLSIAKVRFGTGYALEVDRWTSTTAFSANQFTWSNSATHEIGDSPWFKIASDGTTLTFYISANGTDWAQLYSETIAAFLGGVDQVGLFMDQENASDITGVVDWYEDGTLSARTIETGGSAGGSVITDATTARTAIAGDAGGYIRFTNGSAITLTIPANADVAYPIGTVIEFEQAGAGALTIAAAAGVTINSRAADYTLAGQYATGFVKKVDTNTWTLGGDL